MWQTNKCECVDETETCCITVSNVLFLWRFLLAIWNWVAEKGAAGHQFERKGEWS